MSDEGRRYLRSLFGSWASYMGRMAESHDSRLKALPETPDSEEWKLNVQWIHEFVGNCDEILKAIEGQGVLEASIPFVDTADPGGQIPEEVRRAAVDLREAWFVLFVQVRHKAIDWAARRGERDRAHRDADKVVAEWSERLRLAGEIR